MYSLQVHIELGCTKTPIACDIRAACSGFVLGLFSAACYVRGGGLHNILVIGADAVSRFTDWTDRGTCVLFGDAAGAVVVQACDAEEDGLISFDLHSDGEVGRYVLLTLVLSRGSKKNKEIALLHLRNLISCHSCCRHLGSSMKHTQTNDLSGSNGSILEFPSIKSSYPSVQMNGQEVLRFAVRRVPQTIESALKKASLTASDIDWLLLHQLFLLDDQGQYKYSFYL
ncbi:3-ketoacyl-acyl carrier protein synthase III [Hibiscus trionum]|uniref:3-ketoacyl-acyl carrier protein synthase III n=1 Tax=Hibiscus trionum TaxID=183268 RepID=A0A9W7GQT1_HIBTR|nr:3-ketoacyl-acyl carrier protein synthase III [Hibiscus trionum]